MAIPPDGHENPAGINNDAIAWREVLNFVREENKRDREHLSSTFQIVIWATTAVLGVALFAFFYMTRKSLSEARESARSDVKQRLDEEFSEPNLKALIEQSAREATRRDLSIAIQGAVRDEVASARSSIRQEVAQRIKMSLPLKLTNSQILVIRRFLQEHVNELSSFMRRGQIAIVHQAIDRDAESLAIEISAATLLVDPNGGQSPSVRVSFHGIGEAVSPAGISFCMGERSGVFPRLLTLLEEALDAGKVPYNIPEKIDPVECRSRIEIRIGGK
jgi:hypothetical protein